MQSVCKILRPQGYGKDLGHGQIWGRNIWCERMKFLPTRKWYGENRDIERWCGGRALKEERDVEMKSISAKGLTLSFSAVWELNLRQQTTQYPWSAVFWGCLGAEWQYVNCPTHTWPLCLEANRAETILSNFLLLSGREPSSLPSLPSVCAQHE